MGPSHRHCHHTVWTRCKSPDVWWMAVCFCQVMGVNRVDGHHCRLWNESCTKATIALQPPCTCELSSETGDLSFNISSFTYILCRIFKSFDILIFIFYLIQIYFHDGSTKVIGSEWKFSARYTLVPPAVRRKESISLWIMVERYVYIKAFTFISFTAHHILPHISPLDFSQHELRSMCSWTEWWITGC